MRVHDNGDGRLRVLNERYSKNSTTFTTAVVAFLQQGQWYRFDSLNHFVDGPNDSAPNDLFTLIVFGSNGVQLRTACDSTWEMTGRPIRPSAAASPRAA